MQPILFETTYFTLYSYWIFLGISIIISFYILTKLCVKNNLKTQFLSDNLIYLILFSFIGARLLFVATNYDVYFRDLNSIWSILYIWDRGFHGWGAILSFFVTFYILAKRNEQNFYKWLDILVPSIIIGIGISSLGAFFDGINYGKETTLPWGVNFESFKIKYTVPIHPTQIYSLIYCILIGSSLIIINQISKLKEKKLEGLIGIHGILTFSIFKFLEEFLRGDDTWMIFNLRIGHILSFLTAVFTGIFLFYYYNKRKKNLTKHK